jgi:D-arabinose 1-dehydrogenase-like Zn-dependent alcohol dehydrogenase
MRAVVLDRIRGPLAVRVVPDPSPPDGGVVVRVLATGMCRSDWHGWAGHDEITLPHVPGHELAGVVVAVGDGVSRWSAGDRVTVPFVEGCGRCAWCLSGNAQVCPDQKQHPGMLSLIERGDLRPQALVERVISSDEASVLLPAFDLASPAGMTMIDPRRA